MQWINWGTKVSNLQTGCIWYNVNAYEIYDFIFMLKTHWLYVIDI